MEGGPDGAPDAAPNAIVKMEVSDEVSSLSLGGGCADTFPSTLAHGVERTTSVDLVAVGDLGAGSAPRCVSRGVSRIRTHTHANVPT